MPSTAVTCEVGDDVLDVVVDGVDRAEPVAEARQPLRRERQGLAVAVDADDGALREALEHALGVAAHAERAVDVHRTGPLERGREQVEDAVAHDGDVASLRRSSIAHVRPSHARAAGGPCWCICGARGWCDCCDLTGDRDLPWVLVVGGRSAGVAVIRWRELIGVKVGRVAVRRSSWCRRTWGLVPIRCLARDGGSRPGSGAAGGRHAGGVRSVVGESSRVAVRWCRRRRVPDAQKSPGITSSAVSAKLCSVCSR